MRVAVGGFWQESGSFLPQRTTLREFERCYLARGVEVLTGFGSPESELPGFLTAARSFGWEIRPTLGAGAMPWGPVAAETRAALEGELLERLERVLPVDGVYLTLHGAMVAEDEEDVEGHLLQAVRHLVGPTTPIVATLDLHAHVTPRMVEAADGLVGYHTFPHVDQRACGIRAAELLARQMGGAPRPFAALRKLPMITPAESHLTTRPPMATLMEQVLAYEQEPGVLVVTLYPVQPWLDVRDLGWAVLAYATSEQLAWTMADRVAAQAWLMREQFLVPKLSVEEAIARVRALGKGPVVLSESADNTGGGGPGDSTWLLRGLVEAGADLVAYLTVVDPEAVAAACAAGEGATIRVALGGKSGPLAGPPLPVEARVLRLTDGRFAIEGPSWRGMRCDLGRTALLGVGELRIVTSEQPGWTIDPSIFRHVGLDPLAAQILHTKSPTAFRAAYEPIAREILLVDTPGYTASNFATLPFTRISRPLFPLDPVPERLPFMRG